MSELLLVRHGQASFMQADYDRLSELGEQQAVRLGEFWLRHSLVPSRILVGPRLRQRQTAELCVGVLAAAGFECPAFEFDAAWDEHPGEFLVRELLASGRPREPELQALFDQLSSADQPNARARATELLLKHVMRSWRRGALEPGQHETWHHFRTRLSAALEHATLRPERGQRVAVFSSGGAIAAVVASVVQAPDEVALELGWSVQNASVTELRFSAAARADGEARVSLSRFNSLAHLDRLSTWTYR